MLRPVPTPGVPPQPFLPNCRRSVLPVHLLCRDGAGFGRSSLAALLCGIGPVAGDVELEDDSVVHDPVNRRGSGNGVGDDAFPLREDQVGRDAQRPALVAFDDQRLSVRSSLKDWWIPRLAAASASSRVTTGAPIRSASAAVRRSCICGTWENRSSLSSCARPSPSVRGDAGQRRTQKGGGPGLASGAFRQLCEPCQRRRSNAKPATMFGAGIRCSVDASGDDYLCYAS